MRRNGGRMHDIDWTERMTARARGYLTIAGVRHLLIGVSCVLASDLFVSPAYTQIKNVLPIPVWGVLFLTNSALCLVAAAAGSGAWARVGLIASAASTAVWGGGFVAAIAFDIAADRPISGPTGVVIFFAVAGKDLVVCRNPMRSPFEDLGQRILEAENGKT